MTPRQDALTFLSELQQEYLHGGAISPIGRKYYSVVDQNVVYKYWNTFDYREGVDEETKALLGKHISKLEAVVRSHGLDFAKHESLYTKTLLSLVISDIKRVFRASRISFPEDVAVGTAFFGQLNALAGAPNKDSATRVILLDHGIFTIVNAMSKVVSTVLPSRKEATNNYSISFSHEDIDVQLSEDAQCHRRFVDIICAYLIYGDANRSQVFEVSDENDSFVNIVRHSAEVFIVAHEYGHIVQGHLASGLLEKREMATALKLETWQIDWVQEFQADTFASMIVMRLNHHLLDMGAEISFVGIPILFTLLDILYQAIGVDFSESHPSPKDRLSSLWSGMYKDTPDKELVDEIALFCESITAIIYRLWTLHREEIIRHITDAKAELAGL